MKKSTLAIMALLALVAWCLPASIQAQDKEAEKLLSESSKAKTEFIKTDPSMAALFESAHG